MYSKVLGDDYVYKSCDFVTVHSNDDKTFTTTDDVTYSDFSWDIPTGSYNNDFAYDHSSIITVELVTGHLNVNGVDCLIQYSDGVKNQFSSNNKAVLCMGCRRASNSIVLIPSGELIVSEKPTTLRLRVAKLDRTAFNTDDIVSMCVALKFSYYVKKPSRIEPAPACRFA